MGQVRPLWPHRRDPRLLQGCKARRFRRMAEIYAQDDETDGAYVLLSGVVRSVRVSPDGRRQVGEFYHPGDIFGVESAPRRRFSADALNACEALFICRSRSEPAVRELLEASVAAELERTQDHLLLLGRRTARERVASFLVDTARRSGGTGELVMGRQDIADYLGLTIETVSRMLTELQADRVFEFEGPRRFRATDRVTWELAAA